ncbi:site-specific DNA-methyltransferase [Sediminimonas qiaohouensis]|uniref:site-specific DNA-methyltransferase n=1 Tax=Sediminimonas qiaohouensis TaxID=552061 RepID=UPI000403CA02|nr:site-specific DNA-methyltransferase [Sediminimonas qiaohouensis]
MPLLHWLTRDEDLRAADRVPYRLLDEVPDLSFGDGDEGLLVQGDNLEALKALLPFYAGRVKCIYIDPPYNTRSAFEHYDDSLEHAKWLAMVVPRLMLLREFLSEDGSIWVSIDDREGHYLKVVMDELFGRRNFRCTFIWRKVDSPNDNKVPITPDHEFVLVYEKNSEQAGFRQKSDEGLLDSYRVTDEEPRPHRDRLIKKNGKNSLRADRPTMFFPIEAPDGTDAWPIHDDGREANWAFGKKGVDQLRKEGRLIWKQRERQGKIVWVPYSREFASSDPKRPNETIWTNEHTTRQAKAHARELLPNVQPIDTIKPEKLISRILHIATTPGDLVLDSFLGSGTTAAVAHKMGRRWIGVEMGEHARTHCALRLQKVIEGEQGGISKDVGWEGGGGFRFCTLGPEVFDEDGRIDPAIRFADLARHVWFSETRQPMTDTPAGPLLGVHDERAVALLYNGILKDRSAGGGNVLTRAVLKLIRDDLAAVAPDFEGDLVVYGAACRLSEATLKDQGILFRQTPYDISART